jgi:hypothetical protein
MAPGSKINLRPTQPFKFDMPALGFLVDFSINWTEKSTFLLSRKSMIPPLSRTFEFPVDKKCDIGD